MQPGWPVHRMMSGTRLARGLGVVMLVLQGLLWGGGSVLEARTAAESLTRVTHIEDEATTTCPPLHSHLDCIVCRTLNHGATAGSAPASVSLSANTLDRLPVDEAWSPDPRAAGSLGSRAPPA